MNVLKERMAKGFQKIEDMRLNVKYIMIHPDDFDIINREYKHETLKGEVVEGDTLHVWGAKIIKTDVMQKGLVLVCSMLFEEEPPLNRHQITEIIDISDLS